MLARSTLREIKDSLGRYLALMLIIALGVGFFAGLKVTDPAMRTSMHQYLTENEFYDFRLLSSVGFEQQDIDYLKDNLGARYVEESIAFDIITEVDDTSYVLKAISLPSDINKIVLVDGTLPAKDDECVVDMKLFDSSHIGNTILLSDSNESEDTDKFAYKKYRICGIVKSPLYIQYERGTTTLGTGVLDGFMYVKKGAFDVAYFTDCYVKLDSDPQLYSDEYDQLINDNEDAVQAALDYVANARYQRIVEDATAELDDARKELEDTKAEKGQELSDAKTELDDAKKKLTSAKKSISEYEDMESQLQNGLDEMLANINQMEQAMAIDASLVDQAQYQGL